MKFYEFHNRAQERIGLLKQMLVMALLLFLRAKPQPRTRCWNLALEVRGSRSFFINGTTPFHNNHTVSFHLPAPIVWESAAEFQGIAATRLISIQELPASPTTYSDQGFSCISSLYQDKFRDSNFQQAKINYPFRIPPSWSFPINLPCLILFVTNSVKLVQRMPYQGSSGWAWRLQHRRANYSNSEICRWPCTYG